jgi:hypothetical protein
MPPPEDQPKPDTSADPAASGTRFPNAEQSEARGLGPVWRETFERLGLRVVTHAGDIVFFGGRGQFEHLYEQLGAALGHLEPPGTRLDAAAVGKALGRIELLAEEALREARRASAKAAARIKFLLSPAAPAAEGTAAGPTPTSVLIAKPATPEARQSPGLAGKPRLGVGGGEGTAAANLTGKSYALKRRPHRTGEEWRALFDAWVKSGQSVSAFCNPRVINPATISVGFRKLFPQAYAAQQDRLGPSAAAMRKSWARKRSA